jgi:hypothetical protein
VNHEDHPNECLQTKSEADDDADDGMPESSSYDTGMRKSLFFDGHAICYPREKLSISCRPYE